MAASLALDALLAAALSQPPHAQPALALHSHAQLVPVAAAAPVPPPLEPPAPAAGTTHTYSQDNLIAIMLDPAAKHTPYVQYGTRVKHAITAPQKTANAEAYDVVGKRLFCLQMIWLGWGPDNLSVACGLRGGIHGHYYRQIKKMACGCLY